MKGMEGGADSNSDNQITARELYTYVKANVVQQEVVAHRFLSYKGMQSGYW